MAESPNDASSRQRRANWVGLRTLRQRPKAVGETADGETVYEVRSVRLMLDGSGAHFVRVATCSRCGQELAGNPVLTPLDLDRPVRPVICTDCIRQAGVSTVWDAEGVEPVPLRPPAAEEPAPAVEEEPAPPAPPPADWVVDDKQVARVDAMERHLRAVTDRINELGRVARAQQSEAKARAEQEEAAAAALREEVAALRAALDDARRQQAEREEAAAAALRQELASVRAALDEVRAQSAGQEPGAGGQADVARLLQQLETQSAELARLAAAVADSRTIVEASAGATRELARSHDALDRRLTEAVTRFSAPPADPPAVDVDAAVASRVAEAEGRLSHQVAAQWGDLETAIESSVGASVAGVARANEERVEALARQLAQVSSRLDTLVERLGSMENRPAAERTAPEPAGDFMDALDRQLDAAARRLAARSVGGGERP
jgi:hypothetical protein